eukprot:4766278-Pyramimonas_sp.AAC.1
MGARCIDVLFLERVALHSIMRFAPPSSHPPSPPSPPSPSPHSNVPSSFSSVSSFSSSSPS